MESELEAFINQRVLPQHEDTVRNFCEQMRHFAPRAELRMRGGTEKYYSVPVFRLKQDFVAISPTKRGITISFTFGAEFEDPFQLLGGAGKRSRTVRIGNPHDYPKEAMAHYIREALKQQEE